MISQCSAPFTPPSSSTVEKVIPIINPRTPPSRKKRLSQREKKIPQIRSNPSMADYNNIKEEEEDDEENRATVYPILIIRIMSKRRTWVFLFVAVYSILLSSSWNILKSVLSWYQSSSNLTGASFGWPALYASVILGAVFGLLSMAAALAVAVPATLVTWITVLVLLTFCGKPRRALVVEGKKLTWEIAKLVAKILIKEGNLVAAVCALLGYFFLVRRGRLAELAEAAGARWSSS